jgi:hypothetical protein
MDEDDRMPTTTTTTSAPMNLVDAARQRRNARQREARARKRAAEGGAPPRAPPAHRPPPPPHTTDLEEYVDRLVQSRMDELVTELQQERRDDDDAMSDAFPSSASEAGSSIQSFIAANPLLLSAALGLFIPLVQRLTPRVSNAVTNLIRANVGTLISLATAAGEPTAPTAQSDGPNLSLIHISEPTRPCH